MGKNDAVIPVGHYEGCRPHKGLRDARGAHAAKNADVIAAQLPGVPQVAARGGILSTWHGGGDSAHGYGIDGDVISATAQGQSLGWATPAGLNPHVQQPGEGRAVVHHADVDDDVISLLNDVADSILSEPSYACGAARTDVAAAA